MAQTTIARGSALSVKKWAAMLYTDLNVKSYFTRTFVGKSENSVIQQLTDLEKSSGDHIQFDLSVRLRGAPTYGDDRLENTEESLVFYSDEIYIDQVRKAVSAGGKMSQKRTIHNLRTTARSRLSDYFAMLMDEYMFCYLSGSRGINEDFVIPTDFTGFANNTLTAPDSVHMLFGGDATSTSDITSSDTMSVNLIERAVVQARMMQAKDSSQANMVPIDINGSKHYVCVMNPYQEHDMRVASGDNEWLDLQKALATADGRNNKIFKGGLGMINNVVLQSHESVIRYSSYGADSDLPAARALFLGRQAGAVAYGSPNAMMRFNWTEERKDYDNLLNVAGGTILGIKKSRFNGHDFGVMSMDTYAADPNSTDE